MNKSNGEGTNINIEINFYDKEGLLRHSRYKTLRNKNGNRTELQDGEKKTVFAIAEQAIGYILKKLPK